MHQGLPVDADQVVTDPDVTDRAGADRVAEDRAAADPRPASWRASVAAGLRGAWRARRLVAIVWFAFFLLAAFAAVPTWHACDVALSHTPESERLLDGLNIALLRELATTDGPAPAVTLPWMIAASALMALLWNPFVSGGMLTVLLGATGAGATGAGAGVRERFFAGGARHYWRLFRLLTTMLVIGVVALGLAGVVLFGIGSSVDERGWERLSLALTGANLALLAALAGLLSMIADYARIAIVRDGRRLAPAIWTGTRLLFRRPLAVIAFGLTFLLLLALLTGLYVEASGALPFRSWAAIGLGVLFQQLFSLTRTGLRVAMVAGELSMLPRPAVAAAPAALAPELVPESLPAPADLEPVPAGAIAETPAVSARQHPDLNDLPPLA
jgi:hypothetical protein